MSIEYDKRLVHLLKIRREAAADVNRYVKKTWPIGADIEFLRFGKPVMGAVTAYQLVDGHLGLLVRLVDRGRSASIKVDTKHILSKGSLNEKS